MYLKSDLPDELTFVNDHDLMVTEVRERLCVSQGAAQKFDVGILISRK